jgi:hypothetical protein
MKLIKIIRLVIIIPLLALDLYGMVRLIVDMINTETDLGVDLLVLFFMVFVAGMLIWTLLPMFRSDRLLKRGKPAVATVLKVWDTGVTVNQLNILVGLLLEVHPPGHPPYQVKTRTLVSRIQPTLYRPGMVVQVRYDPKNPKKVAIEGIGPRAGNGAAAIPTGMIRAGTAIYQGKAYTSVDDLPPDARAKYEKAMFALADKDGDGIPDILEGVVGNISVVQAGQSTGVPRTDPAEKLRKLEEMLDEGLITQQEYEAKKAEILSRM